MYVLFGVSTACMEDGREEVLTGCSLFDSLWSMFIPHTVQLHTWHTLTSLYLLHPLLNRCIIAAWLCCGVVRGYCVMCSVCQC